MWGSLFKLIVMKWPQGEYLEKTFHPGFIEGGIKGRDMLLPISLEPTDLIRSRRGDGSHLRHEMSHLLDRPSGSLTTCHCHCLCLCHCLSSSCHLRHGMSHLLDGPSGSSPTCQGQSSGGLKIPFSGWLTEPRFPWDWGSANLEHQSFPGGDKEERTAQLSIAFFAKDKRQKTKNEKDKKINRQKNTRQRTKKSRQGEDSWAFNCLPIHLTPAMVSQVE